MFVEVGDRVKWITKRRFRYEDWPANAWVQKGVKGTVTEIYPSDRGYDSEEREWYIIPAAAAVKWDNGGKSLIHDGEEGQVWEKIEETVMSVKGERELSIADYDKLYTLNELRKMCRERGIYPSGDKKVLVSKLLSQEVWDVDEIKSKIQALPPEQRREILTKYPHLALE